jgi:hypothetical protein
MVDDGILTPTEGKALRRLVRSRHAGVEIVVLAYGPRELLIGDTSCVSHVDSDKANLRLIRSLKELLEEVPRKKKDAHN